MQTIVKVLISNKKTVSRYQYTPNISIGYKIRVIFIEIEP